MQSHRIIRNKAAWNYLGISSSTYWRLIKAGELPAPVQISKQASGQPEHVLVSFIERRAGAK
ncbi:helix-turn-helix transcriptional regulator [Acidihalobacter prosperus]|uniref:AlpA family phage regulatory protein n=1 Tax=Acidihalobacter prosperus TaxID=160660 RepID=A0A1A6C6G3_9GAMM|nr:AlpA family phage regulatory protein [Acidihalobacter prosperus]OBS10154.1 hypothetical protein Thpro_021204 [Acidihalobacter prosperus]